MKANEGIWTISTGKGNRIYINCNDESKVIHSHSLCESNGLGLYGFDHLKDLAVSILKFEKEKQFKESIEHKAYYTDKPPCGDCSKHIVPCRSINCKHPNF